MVKAIIFDKDGVLMDTEKTYFRAYQDTILQFGGSGTYGWDDHRKFMGMLSSERFLKIKKKFNIPVSFDDFINEYRNRYIAIFEQEGVKVPEGLSEFLQELKSANIKCAIATSSSRRNTEFTLRKANLINDFDATVTADDVSQGKPHPEQFLLAAHKLQVAPAGCLVIGEYLTHI